MHELIKANHIDIGVHFNYMASFDPNHVSTPADIDRLGRCMERIRERSQNPGYLFFYFSAYYEKGGDYPLKRSDLRHEQPALEEERMRMKTFGEWLGPRFFPFSGWEHPNKVELDYLLESKGFTYNPSTLTSSGMGEWLGACLDSYAMGVWWEMGLQPNNCQLLTDLSLPCPAKIRTSPQPAVKPQLGRGQIFLRMIHF